MLDRHNAVLQAAETALRDTIGQHELDDLLQDRMRVNGKLMELLEGRRPPGASWSTRWRSATSTSPNRWSVLAREAEAIREARARLIKAQGLGRRRSRARRHGPHLRRVASAA